MLAALEQNGYILFENVLPPADVQDGTSAIGKDEVDYSHMTHFIEEKMLPCASRQMNGNWNITYTKYRVSDNNNSDATSFHRDVICFGEWLPVLTCLTYFDETVMEVVPGSHTIQTATYSQAASMFSNRVKLHMKPGSILLFYSTMLHRGIFTESKGRRRLIQVFDCFQTPTLYKELSPKLIHITGDESLKDGFTMMSKIPIFIDIINMYGYLNAMTGYGGKESLQSLSHCSLGGRTTFCSEGFCNRLDVIPGSFQIINKYILANHPYFDLPLVCRPIWKWNLYTKQTLFYLFITLIFMILLVYAVYSLYKYSMPIIKQTKTRLRSKR